MDESLSWRAKLAKANINILDVHDNTVFLEFTYHPKPGVFKWCKTYFVIPEKVEVPESDPVQWIKFRPDNDDIADAICAEVLKLRKELEG